MEKLLSLLLCGLLLLTSLAACNNESENSSEASSQESISSEAESSIENSSVAESSEESSQEPEPYISEIPEKAVYFTSDYTGINVVQNGPIFGEKNLREYYSCTDNQGLYNYFKNNEVSDDTYFLVGMVVSSTLIDYDYISKLNEDEGRALIRTILEPYDFIEWENHKMLYDQEKTDEFREWLIKYDNEEHFNDIQRYYDHYELIKKYMDKRFPGIELPDLGNPYQMPEHEYMNYYYYATMLTYRFDIIGYISAKDLKQLNEDLKDGEQVVCVTWFPAPDDQERWLTASPYYNPED